MMNKSKNPKLELCKLRLLLPVTLLMLMSFSSKAQPTNQDGKLPLTVKCLDIKNKKAVVRLQNGSKENFDLSVPSEKTVFESKYGKVPFVTRKHVPTLNRMNTVQKAFEVKNVAVTEDHKVTVYLINGGKEHYDLNIAVQKNAYIKMYGTLPLLPTAPSSIPAPPARL